MKAQNKPKAQALKTFKGAVAIVTGGASGIGRALALELANLGAHAVVIMDRQEADQVATELRDRGTEAVVYNVDVRDYAEVERVIQETKEAYGRLDYIFNNAGTLVSAPMERIGVEDFNYVIDVNLRGVANGIHAAYPIMKEQGFGHIVNTASMAGLNPAGEGFAAYGTSKFAVVGLSTNLRIEAARHGVRVSVLCPGFIRTPILKHGGQFGKDFTGIPQDAVDAFIEKYHPMDPIQFATKALKLVAKNKPIIILPARPYKRMWFMYRFLPSLSLYVGRMMNDKMVKKFEKARAERNDKIE